LHQLHHFPHIPESPSRAAFKDFPWHRDEKSLAAWKEGFTGYPLVDAGMRELNETGWMHNRVRMIVASFLVKHLLISWQTGAHWFWEKLLDADLANNTMGWQWSAGCGFDASPYFRIFNPVLQGKKFDPEGEYVRRWVPELADIDKRWIHEPWKSPNFRVTKPKTSEGRKYPRPIVDHAEARERALAALASIQR
jgi:deoxyribodipyrimidine photo-lyase